MPRLVVVLAVAACSGRAAALPPVPVVPTVRVAERAPLGWLALAGTKGGGYEPVTNGAAVIPWDEGAEAGLASGATFDAIGTAGDARRVTARTVAKIHYGCDENTLVVVPLEGAQFAAGLIWVLPRGGAEAWRPTPTAIEAKPPTAKQRVYTIGGIAVTLSKTDAMTGVLQISRDGITLHTLDLSRGAMDGDTGELDLVEGGPGVPAPVAAWRLGEGASAPVLLATLMRSHEGFHLAAYLVEARTLREANAMRRYLYYCAF